MGTNIEVDSMPRLAPLMGFAFQGGRDSSVFVAEHTLAFTLGRVVATYNAEDKPPMRFSEVHSSVKETLSVTISPNRKFLVVCERPHSDHAQVALLKPGTLERLRTLTSGVQGDVVSCAFSHDSSHLMAIINDAEWRCLVWRLDNFSLTDSFNVAFKVDRISVCPTNSREVVVSGPKQLRVWKCSDGEFNQGGDGSRWKDSVVPGIGSDRACRYKILDHAWVSKAKFAVATEEAGILIVHKHAVVHRLEVNFEVRCIVPHSKGFFAAGAGGKITSYTSLEKAQDAAAGVEAGYRVGEEYAAPDAAGTDLVHISVSPTETVAAVVLRGAKAPPGEPVAGLGAVLSFSISNMQISEDAPAAPGGVELAMRTAKKEDLFSPLLPGFHSGPVTSIDTCSRRPLIVSCSSVDCTVRVWDYTAFTCELVHRFPLEEQPLAVAINPLGTHLLVAFKHRVVVMVLLMDQLFHARHLTLKSCSCLRFSPGGHLVAAVTNLRDIAIYETVTWGQRAVLKGHVKRIRALAWADDGLHLTSVGEDSAVYTWTMDGFHKMEEHIMKGSEYTAVLVTPGRAGVLLAEEGVGLRMLRTTASRGLEEDAGPLDALAGGGLGALMPGEVYNASVAGEYGKHLPIKPRAIALSPEGNVLVGGQAEGQIRVIPYPLGEESCTGEKYAYHAGDVQVTHVVMAPGGGMVFTADDGGSMLALALIAGDDTAEGAAVRLAEEPDREAGMVLVQLPEQRELLSDLAELRVMYSKAVSDTAYKLEMQELEWSAQVKAQEEEAAGRQEALKDQISELDRRVVAEGLAHRDDIEVAAREKERALHSLQESMDHKIAVEIRRTNKAEKELEKLKRKFGREIAGRDAEMEASIKQVEAAMQKLEIDTGAALAEAEHESEMQQASMAGLLEGEMKVHEDEVQAVLDTHEAALEHERAVNSRIRGEATFYRGLVTKSESDTEAMRAAMEAAEAKLRDLRGQHELLTRERDGLKSTLDQREEVIIEKDRAYNELLKRCRDNEVYALVRDQKIAKMHEMEAPMQARLDEQEELITDMEAKHLEQMEIHRRNERLRAQGQQRHKVMEKEVAKLRRALMDRERAISVFTVQLSRIVETRPPDQWGPAILGLYTATLEANPAATAIMRGEGEEGAAVPSELKEVMRQRASLESFVNTLKTIMKRQGSHKDTSTSKVYEENVELLQSLAETRRDKMEYKSRCAKLEREVTLLKADLANGKDAGGRGPRTSGGSLGGAWGEKQPGWGGSLPPARPGSRQGGQGQSRHTPPGTAAARAAAEAEMRAADASEPFGAFSAMGMASAAGRPGTTPNPGPRGAPLVRATTPGGLRDPTPEHVAGPEFRREGAVARARRERAAAGAAPGTAPGGLRAEQSEPAIGAAERGAGLGRTSPAGGGGGWPIGELDANYQGIMDRRGEIEKLRLQSLLDAQRSEIEKLRLQVMQMAQAGVGGAGGWGDARDGASSRASTPDEMLNFIGARSLAGPAGSPLVPEGSSRSAGTFKGGYNSVKKRAQRRLRPETPLDALDPATKALLPKKGTSPAMGAARTGGGGAASGMGLGRPAARKAPSRGGGRPSLEDSADFSFTVGQEGPSKELFPTQEGAEPLDWRAGRGRGAERSDVSLGAQAEAASLMVEEMIMMEMEGGKKRLK